MLFYEVLLNCKKKYWKSIKKIKFVFINEIFTNEKIFN